jgi:hypothetical protein
MRMWNGVPPRKRNQTIVFLIIWLVGGVIAIWVNI